MIQKIKDKLKIKPIVMIYEFVVGGLKKTIRNYRKPRLNAAEYFSYGNENADKTFFVIFSPGNKDAGLYSTLLFTVPYIEYAVRKKWIPIVDFKNSFIPNIQDEEDKGKDNAWEYYFEKPCGDYSLDEVYRSKNVIQMLEHNTMTYSPNWFAPFPVPYLMRKHLAKVLKQYVRLNAHMSERLAREREKIFQKGFKYLCMGIRAEFRAGMMLDRALYNGHPKVPSCEELIGLAEDRMAKWKCDKIFVTCEDREYLNKFVAHFGDRCVHMQRRLYHFFENDIPISTFADMYQEFAGSTMRERTEEYIIETYLMAECDCLYATKSGASTFAYYFNDGKYEHAEAYYEGVYEGLGAR